MEKIGRLITAMVTPFKPDGSINYAKAEELASYFADNGCDGLVVRHNRGISHADPRRGV